MVNNNLYKVENTLRSIAKRYKSVKYSLGLAILFLMMGVSAFSEEVVAQEAVAQQEVMTTEQIASSKDNLKDSIGGLKSKIDTARAENEKSLAGLRLELIQLMEQGNQVVKSPWASWQFGANYIYNDWQSSYKGRGDKDKLYPYEGKYQRAEWWTASLSENSKNYKNLTKSTDPYSATTTQRGALGEGDYGFIRRTKIQEKPVEMKLQAGVRPRTVSFTPLNIETPSANLGASLNIPNIDIPVFSPVAPTIVIPTLAAVPNITTPGAGGGNGGQVGFWYANGQGEDDGHAVMSEIDILQGNIDATFNNNTSVDFKVSNFKIQKGDNGQSTTSFGGMPLTGAPYTAPFNPATSVNGRADQAIIKHVDTAVAKYKAGTKIVATNNIATPNYGKQILHYDEHYLGTKYTLDQLVAANIITAADREAWKKYLNMSGEFPTHTVSSRPMQMVENAGDWYLRGHKIMAVNLQAHSGGDPKNSIFRNVGSITGLNEASAAGYIGEHVAFMFTQGDASREHRGFDNIGKIEMRAPLSVIFHHNDGGASDTSGHDGLDIMVNSGTAKLYGQKSAGYTSKPGTYPTRAILRLDKPITLLGDQNIGAVIDKKMFFDHFVIKFDVGTEDPRQTVTSATGVNGLENSGNVTLTMADVPAGTTAAQLAKLNQEAKYLTNNSTGYYSTYAGAYALKDFQINLGKFARDSVGLRVNGSDLTIGNSTAAHTVAVKNFIKHVGNYVNDKVSTTNITTGNILVYMDPGATNKLSISYDTELSVKNSKSATGIFVKEASKLVNKAKITMINAPESKGIIVTKGVVTPDVENYNDIIVEGKKAIGIANYGKFEQKVKAAGVKTNIQATGENAIAVYTNNTANPLKLNSVNVKVKDGAVGLYPEAAVGNKSTMELRDVNIEVGKNALMLYNYTGSNSTQVGDFDLKTDVTASVADGGVAFYNKGTIASIPSYLNMLKGNKTLKLTVKNGGRVFVLDDPSSTFNLSSLPSGSGTSTIANAAGNGSVQITIASGAKYKYYTANGGTLNVDTNVDLSKSTDNYFKNDIMSASVNVTKPMTNNGKAIADGTKYAIAQKNADPTNINKVTVTVNAPITLTKVKGLVGVAVDAGKIINNNTITVTGDNGIGLLGAHKTEMINNKNIIVGNSGIGILGLNKLTSTSQAAGYKITQAANSTIKYSGNAKSAFGVVALNNDGATTTYTSNVTLGANSQIDFSNAVGGIGVLLRGTKINFADNGSIIKVGKQGRGIFIEDKSTNAANAFSLALNGGRVDAHGDNAIGVYTNKTLTTAKAVDVKGKKAAGYYSKENLTLQAGANVTVQDSTGGNNDKSLGVFAEKGVDVQSKVTVGKSSIGIYKKQGTTVNNIQLAGNSEVTVKDGGVGVYAEKANITTNSGTKFSVANNKAIGVYAVKGSTVNNSSTNFSIGSSSFGFVTENSTYNGGTEIATLNKDNSIFLYAKNSTVTDIGTITGIGNKGVGVYGVDSNITSTHNIDLSTGKGNIGIYGEGAGKTITSTGSITVGESILDSDDDTKSFYSIGIAGNKGVRINSNGGAITLKGNNGIGIYATGANTYVENKKDIVFAPTGKVDRMIGMFVNDGATAVNYGNIYTASNYSGNSNVKGLVGIAVVKGTLENHGNITEDADGSFGLIVNNAVIKNYGTITVNGKDSIGAMYDAGTKGATGKNQTSDYNVGGGSITATGPGASNYKTSYNPDKTIPTNDKTEIKLENGKLVVKRDGQVVPDALVNTLGNKNNLWFSNVGIYIDTLGRTNPIQGTGFNGAGINDLIIGAEAADVTNSKNVRIGKNIMQRFINWSAANPATSLDIYSGSLTWSASYDPSRGEAIMAKIDYKNYANKDQNEYNFLDGLEQRYGMNALDSREKALFNKINSIQKNEGVLLTQAFDEMMGHQYANVQQRINATGNILDKEFDYLRSEWQTASKDSNKIKTFGTKGEYNTDTAGVIDYKYNAYGVAYVHENEDIKLGRGIGWYAGIVQNTIKFKDIGNSKEEQLQGKIGIFKSVPFDDNNSLNWTISGDIFAGYNKMKRKFLVVDEVFNAKANYYNYGVSIKNEIGKEFRLSESFTLRPYAALDLEYGRISKIREKSGEVKLEVKQNDYISVKPEIGAELGFKHYFGAKTFRAGLGVAYENELGKVANGKNKARVANTTADWFNIRGEKEDRRGNVKFDLNLGLDNQRFGVTGNVGYDTKGQNVRGGLGLRVIF
ncbi:autotransporter-associated N-terminal domain-containing protein [Fusobacterium polymorphum]|uniref:autotransporter-associated N-terminal domain-containing protein n=1 Tax=Fusobacterium nucleatum subsp. polymorphum TaxID=76857 RepID=UPI0020C1979C|nr:autotransporter-associated N-terminal domain-containing protein [Fusobacterium polymorphum]UTI53686.1 autotransporter-associated N-terminal domain-containing protein [Fusobacterium polymorphum]